MREESDENEGGAVHAVDAERRHRVAIVVPSLRAGGAERAAAALAAHLAERGHAVLCASVEAADAGELELDPRVARVALGRPGSRRASDASDSERGRARGGKARGLARGLARARALAALLRRERSEVAIAFLQKTSALTHLAARALGLPWIAAERNDPRVHRLPAPWPRLGRWAYRRASLVVANSRSVAAWLPSWIAHERVRWIPNAVAAPAAVGRPEVALPAPPFLLAVGRLAPQKDHALLLRAFARTRAARAWSLVVLGEGEERVRLQALARELGIAARCHFPGRARDPWPVYAAAGAFALPSRYEGMPNALLEAMAAGLPAVACDTGAGAAELLAHEESGLLVPPDDPAALAAALDRLAADPALRARLGVGARQAAAAYAPPRVLPRWEDALRSVLAARTDATLAR